MLDNPEATTRLLADLRAALPFEVELTDGLVKHLRTQDPMLVQTKRFTVSELSYAGDEGGIVCHALRSEGRKVLVVSLTQVRVHRSMPLATAIARYQKHRVKKLKQQGSS